MKVAELREKLSKLKKEEVIKLSVEFYKLIPKAKKEDYGIDDFINDPNKTKKRNNLKLRVSLAEIEFDIRNFIEYAREGYYLMPNRVVPKKERSTWRFKVKKWYKELTNVKREDVDLEKQSVLLIDLYELICESCGYTYFSAYDSFQSIGVEQTVFYESTIVLLQKVKGKLESVEKAVRLIIDNYLNRYTLYTDLMAVLIKTLDIPDLKYKGIEETKKLIIENGFKPNEKKGRNDWGFFDRDEYEKERRNNDLTELVYMLYSSLSENDEGIMFFKENYFDEKAEIKLFVLIRMLFGEQKKDRIKIELEDAIKRGIKPRKSLINLLKYINENDRLPRYMN